MATIKSFTSLEQSKKLAKILPLESADYYHATDAEVVIVAPYITYCGEERCVPAYKGAVPCWSLVALLEQLPSEMCDDDGNSSYLHIGKEDDVYQLVYEDPYGDFENIETDRYEHFVDACYEMIIHLHELNLL